MYATPCVNAACPNAQHDNATQLLTCLQSFKNTTVLSQLPGCDFYQPFVTVDGVVLTESIWKTVRTGGLAQVPIIVGGQSGEWQFSAWSGSNVKAYALLEFAMERDFNAFDRTVVEEFEIVAMLERTRAGYPSSEHPDVFPGVDGRDPALMTDLLITCMTDQMTRNHKHEARRYLFSHTPQFVNDTGPQATLQNFSYHTLELGYVFNYFEGFPDEHGKLKQVVRESDLRLSTAIQDYWVSFAKSHTPTSAFAEWPLISEGSMLEFAPGASAGLRSIDFRKAQCDHIVTLFDLAFIK